MVRRPAPRASSPRPRNPRARLSLERLEDRSLLAVNALAPVADHLLITTRAGEVQKVKIEDGTSLDDALAGYRASPDVVTAEPDWLVSISVIPNDTRFGELFGLHNTGQSGGTADADIDAPEAWDVQQGSLKVSVAVIDTGVDYTHQDLYKNIWLNQAEIPTAIRAQLIDTDGDNLITFWDLNEPANAGKVRDRTTDNNSFIDGGDVLQLIADGGLADGIDNDGNGYADDLIGWDFVNGDNNPLDDNNHGTHVSGTIGAMTNNAVGVAGVNWKVQIAGVKFLSAAGSGSISAAQAGLDWAVGVGIKISNNSWGGGGFSSTFSQALDRARTAGHIFVAAAGNSANNNDSFPSYPASYPQDNIVAVAATDRNDLMASFSSYGRNSVDIGAPGVAVLSTTPNNTYSSFSGTSMATPHVAGVLALVKAQYPNDAYNELIKRVLDGANPIASLNGRTVTGGRLNAANALSGLRITGAAANGTASVSAVRVTFSEAINPTTFTAADVTLTGPGGAIAVTGVSEVTGSNNKQFDVTFAAQSAPGSYSYTIGPDIADTRGGLMDQDRDGQRGEAGEDAFAGSFSISSDSAGPRVTAAVANGTTSIGSVRVTFSEAINPTTFTTADVTLTGPSGAPITVTAVTATDGTNTVFDFTFATQSGQGTYTYRVGPNIADTSGNLMDQNQNGQKGEATDVYQGTFTIQPSSGGFTYSNNTPKNLIDWGTTTSTIYVPENIRISDLNVKLNITHTYDSDLTIQLRGPANATPITLINRRGGSSDNFTNTVLDDEATMRIRNGRAPFTGSFRPEQALTAFDNTLARGTWTLIVIDNLPIDEGVLQSWSLTFSGMIMPFMIAPEAAPPVARAEAAAAPVDAVSAPESGDGGALSLAVALVDAGGGTSFEAALFTSRHDTREAPAAVAEALLPRTDARQEARDQVMSGLARRARPATWGWASSWEAGPEE